MPLACEVREPFLLSRTDFILFRHLPHRVSHRTCQKLISKRCHIKVVISLLEYGDAPLQYQPCTNGPCISGFTSSIAVRHLIRF